MVIEDNDDQHGSNHHREYLNERGIGFKRFLDISAHLDAIADRQRGDQRLKRLLNLL